MPGPIRIINLPAVPSGSYPAANEAMAVDAAETRQASIAQVGQSIASYSSNFYGNIGLSPWIVIDTTVTAKTGQRFQCNTTDNAITVALPAQPDEGNEVWTYNYGANYLTIDRNGSTIIGLDEDIIVEVSTVELHLVFRDGTWVY